MIKINKNKKTVTLVILALFLLIGGIFAWNNRLIKDVSAIGESWLTGWDYRKPITVSQSAQPGIVNGNTSFGNTGKIGTAASFDGTGDYVSFSDSPDWDFGSVFTIDFWSYRTNTGMMAFFEQYVDDSNRTIAYYNSSYPGIIFLNQTAGTINLYAHTTGAISANAWHHIAIVKTGTTFNIYVDGVAQTIVLDGGSYSATVVGQAAPLNIGLTNSVASYSGYLDEFRITKGVARWTSNFTPSTTAYTADSYDKLLLHFDEASGSSEASNNIIIGSLTDYQVGIDLPYDSKMQSDFSDVRFTSSDGSTQLNYWFDDNNKIGTVTSTTLGATGKFGTAASFDGGDDYITFPNSNDCNLGAGDFTIDFWTKFNSISSTMELISTGSTLHYLGSGLYGWDISYNAVGSQLQFEYQYNSSWQFVVIRSFTPIVGNWYHIAVVGTGGYIKIFVNGNQIGSDAAYSANILCQRSLHIGSSSWTDAYFYGNLDEVRISKGIARWTSNFTPSTTAYTADQYTKLLLHLDESAGSTIVDSNNFIFSTGTINGGATLGATGKIGTAASFDGTNDYVSFPASTDWYMGTDDFTIEAWFKQNSYADRYVLQIGDVVATKISIDVVSISRLDVYVGSVSLQNTSLSIPLDWNHVAIVRKAGIVKVYLNGTSIASGTQTAAVGSSTEPLNIGAYINTGYQNYWNGSIDEVRISKGIARWTSNFTPSTTAYTADQYTKFLAHLDDVGVSEVGYTGTVPFWVKVPTLTTTNTIYAYYGKSGAATTSNGQNTFLQWHGPAISTFIDSSITLPSSYVYEARGGVGDSTGHTIDWGLSNTPQRLDDGTFVESYAAGNTRYGFTINEGSGTGGSNYETPAFVVGNNYKMKIIATSTIHTYFVNDDQINTFVSTNIPNESMGLQMNILAGSGMQNWSFIRKHTDNKILALLDVEESLEGFMVKKDDGCACTDNSECFYGTCSGGVCGIGGPTATNLTVPSETEN